MGDRFYPCAGCGGFHHAATLGKGCGEEATRYTHTMLDALFPGWVALTPRQQLALIGRQSRVQARHRQQLKMTLRPAARGARRRAR